MAIQVHLHGIEYGEMARRTNRFYKLVTTMLERLKTTHYACKEKNVYFT